MEAAGIKENGGLNGGLTHIDETILEIMIRNLKVFKADIAAEIGKSLRTVERRINYLVEMGYIVRQGSRKTGQWKVIKRSSERYRFIDGVYRTLQSDRQGVQ